MKVMTATACVRGKRAKPHSHPEAGLQKSKAQEDAREGAATGHPTGSQQ